ncbi:hypothetical protein BDW72DRAFT_208603 [Aspergillus terricola var. indicus]
MIEHIEDLPASPPSLYINLEGVNFSRHGTILILQIHVSPHDKTYLVDVHTLNKECVTYKTASGTKNLKTISNALYGRFRINLAGVHDLQLIELATRTFPKKYVNGLARCIENNAESNKGEGTQVNRPLAKDIIKYCVQDVQFLSKLWKAYDKRLTTRWRVKVEAEACNRVRQSQSSVYTGDGKHLAIAPKGWA